MLSHRQIPRARWRDQYTSRNYWIDQPQNAPHAQRCVRRVRCSVLHAARRIACRDTLLSTASSHRA
jgi:hypothetical protein